VDVFICGFHNGLACVCLGFVMCVSLYVPAFLYVGVFICGFSNV